MPDDGLKILPVVGARPNFMKVTPGPGVGGHCIQLDPHYLAWKLKTLNYNTRFTQLAGEINRDMPRYWVDKALRPGSGQAPGRGGLCGGGDESFVL